MRGRVWDANGAPLPGVVIALDIPLLHGGDGRATTRTDASGAYEVGRILAGAGWFTATRYGASEEDHVRLANHVLAFPEGEWAQIDIGSPQGSGRLLATFVNAAGEPLTGGTATARRDDSAERVAQKIQGNGQVSFELAPGPWQMRLWGLDGPHTVEGTAEVRSNQTTEHTFTVAGARIGGSLRNAVGQVIEPIPAKQQVSLRESPVGYIFRSVKVGPDGRYRFDGVKPGT